jgi:hypothetical protein
VDVPAGINNLDARLELRSATGTLIASAAPSTSFGASISTTLAAGSYRLAVASQGSYGDLGQYFVSGTIVPASVPATVAEPSDLVATVVSGTVSLNWTDNASGESAYFVERRASSGTWTRIATLSADAGSYLDDGMAAGQAYEYRVQAASGATLSAFSNVASVVLPVDAPANLTATAASSTRVNLGWSNVAGETGYKIERSIAGGAWSQIGTTGADVTTYADTAAAAGVSYQYRVLAASAVGDSPYSNTASVTTPQAVTTRPAAPSSLRANALSTTQVHLSWQDNSSNESSFVVQRSTNRYTWTTLGSVPADNTAAIDVSAARGRTYYYRAFAVNSAGSSAASNIVRVSTPYYSYYGTGIRGASLGARALVAESSLNAVPPETGVTPAANPPAPNRTEHVARSAALDKAIAQLAERLGHIAAHTNQVEETASRIAEKTNSSVADWLASVDAIFSQEESFLAQWQ